MSGIDLRGEFPPVHDQDGISSCLAFAICDAVWWERRFTPSALFLYYNARVRAGNETRNAAVAPSAALAAAKEPGLCPESLWPYRAGHSLEPPPREAYDAAAEHSGVEFESLPRSETAIMKSLDERRPFFFCLRLFRSNHREFDAGRVLLPRDDEAPVRNHALLAVGYDDVTASVLVRNSLGSAWGDGGHASIPFAYLLDPRGAYAFRRIGRDHQIFFP